MIIHESAMKYGEDDYIMLSALQHFLFCPRQCALIHIEKVWKENYLTMKGNLLHEKAHTDIAEKRKGIYTARGLRLVSKEYAVTGIADVVEFNLCDSEEPAVSCRLPGRQGWWKPVPVEYKKGKTHAEDANNVQLCAQALCLEEMLGTQITGGVIYHGDEKRRETVEFDSALRKLTVNTIGQTHALIDSGITPHAVFEKKCRSCSLYDICMPEVADGRSRKYVNSIFQAEE